jgi:hypothetical protein
MRQARINRPAAWWKNLPHHHSSGHIPATGGRPEAGPDIPARTYPFGRTDGIYEKIRQCLGLKSDRQQTTRLIEAAPMHGSTAGAGSEADTGVAALIQISFMSARA